MAHHSNVFKMSYVVLQTVTGDTLVLDRKSADDATKVFRAADSQLKVESELAYIDDFSHEDDEEDEDSEHVLAPVLAGACAASGFIVILTCHLCLVCRFKGS